MSDPSSSPVRSLVSKHEESIRRASPQPPARTSPTQTRRTLPGSTEDVAAPVEAQDSVEEPVSPSAGKGKELPAQGDLLAPPTASDSSASPADQASPTASSTVLGDIQEDAASKEDESKENGEEESKEEDKAAKSEANGEEDRAAAAPSNPGGDAPLETIAAGVAALPEKDQARVKENLERIAEYPQELPLSASWSTFFPSSIPLETSGR